MEGNFADEENKVRAELIRNLDEGQTPQCTEQLDDA
jgi:hypothetical protein